MNLSRDVPPLHKLSFILLYVLVFFTPHIFITSIENIYELPKAVMIITAGGLFIISALLILLRGKNEKNKLSDHILIDRRLDLPVILLLAAAAVSTVFSLKPYVSYMGQYERQFGLISYIYVFLVYFLSTILLKEEKVREVVSELIQAAGLVVSVYALMQVARIDPFGVPLRNLRVNSTFGNANFAAGFLVMVFPFMLSSALRRRNLFYRTFSILLLLVSVAFMQTRTAYIAIPVQGIVVLGFHTAKFTRDADKRRLTIKRSIIGLAVLVLIGAALVITFRENPVAARILSFARFSENPRWLLWRDSLRLFMAHSFTGTGVSAFSNGFELIISPELRMTETRNYFDNAHNNFLQVLCTMGLAGGAAYVFLMFRSIQLAIRKYLNKSASKTDGIILLSGIGSLTGYIIYGLADFDDPLILLYLFIVIALIKCSMSKEGLLLNLRSASVLKFRKPAAVLILALIAYLCYNIYSSYDVLYADRMFKMAKMNYAAGNISTSVQYLNKAVDANFACSEYKILLAAYIQDYCFQNPSISQQNKFQLLKQAEDEIRRAEVNCVSEVNCKTLLARLYYESGRTGEADNMKEEVYRMDFASLPLRNYLARFYFKNGSFEKMKEELNAIMKYDPQNIDGNTTAMEYYMSINDLPNAEACCRMILKFEPQNKAALQTLNRIKNNVK